MNSIRIKDAVVLEQILSVAYDPMLIKIIIVVHSFWPVFFTCGFRMNDGGVHGVIPCRGLDLRHWIYKPRVAEQIKDYINRRWIYDPLRPTKSCCKIHDTGSGIHFHIQVHPNTRERRQYV